MVGFKIGNEFLDLRPGTTLELVQSNPYMEFGDKIQGDYSFPFEVDLTDKNIRLLQYAGLMQKQVDPKGIEATCYDNDLQHSTGKLKIERVNLNLNSEGRGSASLYYLTGISNFYQDCKNLRLRDIDLGGLRTFPADGYNRNGNGFWAHIHTVLDAPAGYGTSGYDYAFFPVINKDLIGDNNAYIMNGMEYSGGTLNFKRWTENNIWANFIFPFPYLKPVLLAAIKHAGWRIQGTVLNDPDFLKVTLLNFTAIYWEKLELGQPVTFNLKDHLPDKSIPEFLLALKNRFGWWYDFDRVNKIITIRTLEESSSVSTVDLTAQSSSLIPKKINSETKVFALRQASGYDSEHENGQPTNYAGPVNAVTDLPAPGAATLGQSYLVVYENNYYVCQNHGGAYSWDLFKHNIDDYEPAGFTDEIPTDTVTIANEKYNNFHDFTPRLDNGGEYSGANTEFNNSSYGIILGFYYGVRTNRSGTPYPLGGSGIYDANGVQVSQWSLAFECKKTDGTDVGLYERGWRRFLTKLKASEEFELTLSMSLVEYLKLSFNNIIIIQNTRMLIRSIKNKIPFTGQVLCESSRF